MSAEPEMKLDEQEPEEITAPRKLRPEHLELFQPAFNNVGLAHNQLIAAQQALHEARGALQYVVRYLAPIYGIGESDNLDGDGNILPKEEG